MTKRQNIEFLLGWLDALRRKDIAVVAGAMAPDLCGKGYGPSSPAAASRMSSRCSWSAAPRASTSTVWS